MPTDTPSETVKYFKKPEEAIARLITVYEENTAVLRNAFNAVARGERPQGRVRRFYPQIAVTTETNARVNSRLPFGHVDSAGRFVITMTRPDLFSDYLLQQLGLLIENHDVPIEVGESDRPIPLHFAFFRGESIDVSGMGDTGFPLSDVFDMPDLNFMDDAIVNGTHESGPNGERPLGLFTAPRVDYSLHRLQHYTATAAEHFQNYVLFTNYAFYVDEFEKMAKALISDPDSGYTAYVEPGNQVTEAGDDGPSSGQTPVRPPQMPAYHLKRPGHMGITLVNIGVGPSNAKTITDHIAVLRPHAWLMLGHCAGLRNSQKLGDFVLAHGYVRQDQVLDADLPNWVPIPPLAEVQVALEQAVAEVTGLEGLELKRIMRTGTVASIDNRNWELRQQSEQVQQLSQSRAIALDMESATIAANGFRFRVPYGTLLCVSDKPLHGELKLPGMATEFYVSQVASHLEIGMRAFEKMREMPRERLHSRKLRSFAEPALL